MNIEQKIEAICIDSKDYKDNDKMLTLFSKNGKINALIKGVKKPNAKLKAVSQLFSYAEYIIVQRNNFPVIINATLFDSSFDLIQDYDKYVITSHIIKLTNTLSYQIQNDEILFNLLKECIGIIKSNSNITAVENYFLFNLLKIAGYEFDNKHCSKCGSEISIGGYYNQLDNEFCCFNCKSTSKKYVLVSSECLEILNSFKPKCDNNLIKEANSFLNSIINNVFCLNN